MAINTGEGCAGRLEALTSASWGGFPCKYNRSGSEQNEISTWTSTMGIHEDARQGTLDKEKLAKYLAGNASILEEKDPAQGLTPLAAAAVAGYADVVDLLLKRGAKADALSRDGETPLLLTARDGARNRARIVQLLLAKTPAGSVDATSARDKNNTPLMYAVLKKDLETVRQLCKAGASLTATNDDGLTAKDMAGGDRDVVRAFNSDPGTLAKLSSVVVSFLQYVVAWVNKTANGVVRRLYGLNPELNENTDEVVNDGETPNKDQFLENVDNFVSENPVLERFFKGNPNYIRELAKKATELENDKSTVLGCPDLLPKTIKVTLHQQVVYCGARIGRFFVESCELTSLADDSSSMKRDGRWAAQVDLVKRITQITTRILPEGDGVALRFINQSVDDSPNLSLQQIGNIMQSTSWAPNGNTEIGTYLRAKILEPMVYSKLEAKTLGRPLLVSVITDGMPSHEVDSALVDAIKECGDKLQAAGFPRESVKFMIGQVGTANQATKFLNALRGNQEIADVAFVTSDQLDERFAAFKANEADLDRWLIETLFSPIKDRGE
ncbi:hypothetical protein EXIGLDRAFT_75908 [Exidia glandulosa HHB12029]|uniref:Uncharacterized protein n=1 Tax=Exidia glandulosa HHB12029 TaxID=1314781 RepID=A0A165HSQ1_EXIGL|nr:hypothetical protein EXIGLDRAFT_75908 [Exidia glandulosa HHB12029]